MNYTLYLRNPASFDQSGGRQEIYDRCARTFGGYSGVIVDGGWIDPRTDKLVTEPVLRLEIQTDKGPLAVTQLAEWAARLVDQRVVMISGQLTQTIYHKVAA